ncbi:hypothetical protein [Methylobacterium sp. WSM2598]|uniref:hypothetical protein n=1 Tax=Methylobacterium sp. WSM2598 TaxID=398261 RepID=UPI0012F63A73|nr:hypothetical protein [Methylobacterium sp. WSM2598]
MKDSDLYAHRTDLNDAAMVKAEKQIQDRINTLILKIERDTGMDHMDPNDSKYLRYAVQQIKEGNRSLSAVVETLKLEEHRCYRILMRGIADLTQGLVIGAARISATKSSENFFGKLQRRKLTESGRKARDSKRSKRDQIVDENLPTLLARGYGGGRVKASLEKLFSKGGIDPGLATPSISLVQSWIKNQREYGDWRPKSGRRLKR